MRGVSGHYVRLILLALLVFVSQAYGRDYSDMIEGKDISWELTPELLMLNLQPDKTIVWPGVLQENVTFKNILGFTVSYFERVQNNENEQWPLELVNQKLKRRMNHAVDTVVAKQRDLQETATAEAGQTVYIHYHTAALMVALERLLLSINARGIWS